MRITIKYNNNIKLSDVMYNVNINNKIFIYLHFAIDNLLHIW